MLRRVHLPWVFLGLVACSGASVDPQNDAGGSGTEDTGGTGDSGGTVGEPCDGLEGAYALAFEDEDWLLSMVIAQNDRSCEATVARLNPPAQTIYPSNSPAYWPSARFDVDVTDDSLTVRAQVRGAIFGEFRTPTSFRAVECTSFELPRSTGSGQLTGSFSAAAREHEGQDDYFSDSGATFSGTVRPDDTMPTFHVGRRWPVPPFWGNYSSTPDAEHWFSLPEALLPWDTIQVEASKPLVEWIGSVDVYGSAFEDGATASGWEAGELSGIGKASSTWAWARFDDWEAVSGTTQNLHVLAPVMTLSGQEILPTSFPFDVLEVGTAASAFEFDSGLGDVGMWGDVTWLEDVGRARVRSTCFGDAGVAMMVDTGGAKALSVRVTGDGEVLVRVVGASGAELGASAYAEEGEFQTLSVDVSAESRVGVSVVTWRPCHWADDSTVELDWVRAEP